MVALPGIIVRPTAPGSPDFDALVSALDAELEARYPGLSEGTTQRSQEPLVAVVAYLGGRAVGCGALRELESGVAEVKRMFVLPEARGLGVARQMLAELEARASEAGFSALRLGTGLRQPEALALYESSGYRRIPLFGEYEGAEVCVCYEKTLG